MCLFETPSSFQLRKHYSDKHLMQPSEVQLRPSWNNESKKKGDRSTQVSDQNQLRNSQPAISHIPLGIKCVCQQLHFVLILSYLQAASLLDRSNIVSCGNSWINGNKRVKCSHSYAPKSSTANDNSFGNAFWGHKCGRGCNYVVLCSNCRSNNCRRISDDTFNSNSCNGIKRICNIPRTIFCKQHDNHNYDGRHKRNDSCC